MYVALVALVIVIAGCEPDYRGTAFRCDTDRGGTRGCPDDQTCEAGRCRRGGATGTVECGGAGTCGFDEQCCVDQLLTPRCIPAGDACAGRSALCDERFDCADGDFCCDADTTSCGETCDSYACVADDDCPSEAPNCCAAAIVPWLTCTLTPC